MAMVGKVAKCFGSLEFKVAKVAKMAKSLSKKLIFSVSRARRPYHFQVPYS